MINVDQFREALLAFEERSGRKFPWRNTRDPYAVLVAEVLLHRTRAAQVVEMFKTTIREFPSIEALGRSDPIHLGKLLHSAGLRWRVTLLWEAANAIVARFAGQIPHGREDLESIPGIGHYIAAAIRCFAFGEPDAIVDSNVVRIYSRVFEIPLTDGLRRNQDFHRLAQCLIDEDHPREFNYAILDLAAAICTPANPKCEECPIAQQCAVGCRILGLNPPPSDLRRTPAGVPVLLGE